MMEIVEPTAGDISLEEAAAIARTLDNCSFCLGPDSAQFDRNALCILLDGLKKAVVELVELLHGCAPAFREGTSSISADRSADDLPAESHTRRPDATSL